MSAVMVIRGTGVRLGRTVGVAVLGSVAGAGEGLPGAGVALPDVAGIGDGFPAAGDGEVADISAKVGVDEAAGVAVGGWPGDDVMEA